MQAAEVTLDRDHLAALGELSRGLFHDLASPLSSITLVAEYICSYADSDPVGVRDCAESLRRSCRDLGSLVQTIREYLANPRAARRFSLREQAERAGTLLAHRARRQGGVEIVVAGETPAEIFARPLPVLQVLVNLVANAIDACAERSASLGAPPSYRGRVAISTSVEGGVGKIRVADNGVGMDPGLAAHIFERHFSTKDRSRGTGIGLSSVQVIVRDILGGTISLETAPGEGAVFYVEFPEARSGGGAAADALE